MVLEVYIEKRGECGPVLQEHRTGEEKPAKKTDKGAEGTQGEFDGIAKKIEYSSIRNKLKGPALQNAAQRSSEITSSIFFNGKTLYKKVVFVLYSLKMHSFPVWEKGKQSAQQVRSELGVRRRRFGLEGCRAPPACPGRSLSLPSPAPGALQTGPRQSLFPPPKLRWGLTRKMGVKKLCPLPKAGQISVLKDLSDLV